jgi:3-oxoacyl-[acyl-carrier protein] reductase
MNLGIAGRRALLCGSSRGLGRACAEALAEDGVHIVVNGRDQASVQATATELQERFGGVEVTPVIADVTTAEGRGTLIRACPQPDILLTNNAGPPPGPFLSWEQQDWEQALQANLVAALMLIQAVLPGMRERRFGRIVNVASAMVTSPHPLMSLSTAPRAGLLAVSKGLAREVAADNVTINTLLPERFDTDRQVQMARLQADALGISYEQAREQIASSLPAGRFGRPQEFGAMCAFLCSDQAGFTSGNAIHLDGAGYQGLV